MGSWLAVRRGSATGDVVRPPVALTRLVGRGREVAELGELVAGARMVTLTGVGGSGKTRLAAEVAGDNAVWVELAPCTDPIQGVATALSLREMAERDAVEMLVDALAERELLLVLDNCEHLVEATAHLAARLLAECPRLRILATSREPLGVPGELARPVPPLPLAEAVELFVERAKAVQPAFALTDGNRAAVTEICKKLDGIPLAIELAAARVRLLTPEQIAERLEDRFAILANSARTTIPRHRTLRAAIDWSFALLTPGEQTLLKRLSVFAGSFSLEAVEAVCSGDGIDVCEVLDLLAGLVDKSLVVAATSDVSARYALLETIRDYAASQLDENEAETLRRRHALAFLEVARESGDELLDASVAMLDHLDPDIQNFRAALAWAIDHEPDAIALPLAASFRWYWYYRILWSEGAQWMQRVLERSNATPSRERASVISGAGAFAGYLGDLQRGLRLLEQAEEMWRELGEERLLAITLAQSAHLSASAKDIDTAAMRADESVMLARRAGSKWNLAYCLTNAAAFVAQADDQLDDADRHLEEAAAIWTEMRHYLGQPFVLNARALLALRRKDPIAAQGFARAALDVCRSRSDFWFASRALRILAFTTPDDPLRAAQLLGASDAMLRSLATKMLAYEVTEHERVMNALREALPAGALQDALAAGAQMSFDEVYALAMSGEVSTSADVPMMRIHDLGPLEIVVDGKRLAPEGRTSGRAREMLAFLAAHPEGRSREEIAVAFWPDATSEQLKNSFHVTLHRLRKLLGRQDAVVVEGGRYRLGGTWKADSHQFETAITAALRQRSIDALEQALALYPNDYLHGEDAGEWCLPIRTRLSQLAVRGLFTLGQALETRGKFAEAADAYTRVLARDPYNEAACRQLMTCQARLGARSESILVYKRLEERLREELESAPEAETKALFRRIQQNESSW